MNVRQVRINVDTSRDAETRWAATPAVVPRAIT